MIGGRQSGLTVPRLPGASNALNGLYQPRHRIPPTSKSTVPNCSLTLKDSLFENFIREPEVQDGTAHAEAVLTGGPYEDTAKKVLPRRTSLRYPGSITGHPVRITDTKAPTQRSQQNNTVNYRLPVKSRLTSLPDTNSDLTSSGDEGETGAISASASRKLELSESDGEAEPRNAVSLLSLSTQQTKPVVRRRKDAVLSSADTLTDIEDGQNETDVSERSLDKQHKRKLRSRVTVNLSGTRYDVVRDMVEYVGFVVSPDDDQDCFLIWTDYPASNEKIAELKPYQHINHFPGMGEICRKDCLARNMAKMARVFPLEYNFVPKTWILPSDYAAFQLHAQSMKKTKKRAITFIMKPANGAMGNGIQVVRSADKVPSNEHIIVQEYIEKPFIVDGFKCDMRIYVLITSCDPLRIFLFNDGLLRMSTEPYVSPTDSNLDHLFMHLTNYSINKHSSNYRKDEAGTSGSKRSLRYFNEFLRRQDHDVAAIWNAITDLIIKTMIVAHPHIFHAYRMCRPGQSLGADSVSFEILGFDIMLDKKLRPWLLEVNRSPSFGTDEQLDYDIKSAVIEDALRLVHIRSKDKKKNLAEEKAQSQRRLLKANKRLSTTKSELDKRRGMLERRKEELNALLERVQRDDDREEYENRNIGRYRRIFPPVDRLTRIRYANLMASAYHIFLSGRQAQSLHLEIQRLYSSDLKEYEIREMLAQCEADELDHQQQQQQQTLQSLVPVTAPNKAAAADGLMSKRLQRSPARWPNSVGSQTSLLGRRHSFTPSATLTFASTSHMTRVRLD